MLDDMRGLNVNPIGAIPPEFAEDAADAEKTLVTQEGPAGKITYVERSEDSQLLLELVLDDKTTLFDPALSVYQVNQTILIPLGKFAEDVGYPITVDTAKGTAEGWFNKPENAFRLNAQNNFIELAGKKIPFHQRGIAETHLDDIYVSLDLLTSWFPIGLTLNYNELRLNIKALVDLPVQERAKRYGRWEASKSGQKQPGLEYDPKTVVKLPYRMYAAPALQVSHGIDHSIGADGSSTSITNTSVNATTDLFGMSARAGMAFNASSVGPEEFSGATFTLTKEDYDGNLLGPLKATRYELGDITAPTFPLAGGANGRGVTVTNQPYNFVTDAANFRITGTGTVGWDVEIFQGSELLAFSTVGPDGRFIFANLPLKQGFNLFKTVLYGPNGEKEERFERFYLGQNMVPVGKFYYNASAIQSSTPLFDFLNTAGPSAQTPPTLSLITDYGISKYLSAMGGLFHGTVSDTMLDGAGFGLRTSTKNAYAQFNTFLDKSGGYSANGLLTGNIDETTTYNLQHELHRNYVPGLHSTLDSSSIQISKLFDFKKEIIPDINMTLQVKRDEQETGVVQMAYLGRMSTNFMGLNISNELERDTFNDGSPAINNGSLSIRTRTPLGALQGELSYNFLPKFEATAGSLSLQTNLNSALALTAGINHTFGETPLTRFSSGLDWKLDKVHLGLTGSIDTARSKQINATMAYNLMPRTLYGDYTIAGISDNISSGSLIIRPFIDHNGNGIYDQGEIIIKDARFRNMLRGTLSETAKDGTITLPGLSPNLANRITVDETSITDIFLTPAKKQLVVLGKAGVNGPIDFPFGKLGSISGEIVTTDASGKEVPLGEVQMILLDQNGKQITDTYSESDGYFSFDSIPVGNYELFFPASNALQQYYAGTGEGPALGITFDNPELSDIKLTVEKDRVLIEGAPALPPAENNSIAPAPSTAEDFMPIQLK